MTSITPDQRYRLAHLTEVFGSASKAAEMCKVNRKTAFKWVKRHRETGACDTLPKPGRPHLLSATACKEAYHLFLEEHVTASGVANALERKGLAPHKVHRTTAIRGALTVGPMICLRSSPKPILTEANMHKRVAFAKKHLNTNWDNYLFTDSVRFCHRYPGIPMSRCQWVRPGEQREAPKVCNVRQLHVYLGMCKYGVTLSMEVTGTSGLHTEYYKANGERNTGVSMLEYKEVLKKCLLPQGGKLFGAQGIRHWVLQQDGCTAHNSAVATINKWNAAKHTSVTLLKEWPGNSPDLNPIENVWPYINDRVKKRGEANFAAFKAAVREELANIPIAMIHKLVKSMKKRMQLVIKKEGQRIKY